jgi:hypothetical protein
LLYKLGYRNPGILSADSASCVDSAAMSGEGAASMLTSPVSGSSGYELMRSTYWAVLVLSGLVALTPLAYASPPDPSWIRGVYDDGDSDDVVLLVTSGGGAVEPFPLDDIHPAQMASARVYRPDEESKSAPTLFSNPSRAPPAL